MRTFKNKLLAISTVAALVVIGTFMNSPNASIKGAASGPVVTIDPTQLPLRVTSPVALATPGDSIVAISYFGSSCHGNGSEINSMIGPDGVIVPFSIPSGSAFMVTGVDFANGVNVAGSVAAGGRIGFAMRAVGSGIVLAEGYAVNTGTVGALSGHVVLSTPMRVTSTLCVDRSVGSETGGTRTWVRGFLAKVS